MPEIPRNPGQFEAAAGARTPWQRDFSSPGAYAQSVAPNRERLRKLIGLVDIRVPATTFAGTGSPGNATIAETDLFTARAVCWPVLEGVFGEGLLLVPKTEPTAWIIAVPDADQTPELVCGLASGLSPERQFARRLAEQGCEVLVPVLIDRQDNSSSNQTHRDWIWRLAAPRGRHIIGYEVQKLLAAIDSFAASQPSKAAASGGRLKTGALGYGEGGLLVFYCAALDSRIDAALVSGYFTSRRPISEEPLCRTVFGLLPEFTDADLATLITPNALVVEYSPAPNLAGPGGSGSTRLGAISGTLGTPDYEKVETEFERARSLLKTGDPKVLDRMTLISGTEGMSTGPGSDRALVALLNALDLRVEELRPPAKAPTDLRTVFDPAERQRRQFKQLEDFTTHLAR